jgi:hypothetical protein
MRSKSKQNSKNCEHLFNSKCEKINKKKGVLLLWWCVKVNLNNCQSYYFIMNDLWIEGSKMNKLKCRIRKKTNRNPCFNANI